DRPDVERGPGRIEGRVPLRLQRLLRRFEAEDQPGRVADRRAAERRERAVARRAPHLHLGEPVALVRANRYEAGRLAHDRARGSELDLLQEPPRPDAAQLLVRGEDADERAPQPGEIDAI